MESYNNIKRKGGAAMRMTRLQNRVKQLIYRPGKSRFLSKAAISRITDIDKTIKGGFDGLLEGMGYKTEKEEKGEAGDQKKKGDEDEEKNDEQE